jgi:hypothetical protein
MRLHSDRSEPATTTRCVVPCLDGIDRPYRDLDCAASTPAMQVVADKVAEFLPGTRACTGGRATSPAGPPPPTRRPRERHRFAGRPGEDGNVVVLCRNTTEAINQLAYRLGSSPTTWWPPRWWSTTPTCSPGPGWPNGAGSSAAPTAPSRRRRDAVLDDGTPTALLALTGASNVTGWLPPVEEICAEAHARGIPSSSMRPSWPPPSPAPGSRLHRLQRAQALRPLRGRRPDRAAGRLRDRRPLPRRRRRRRPGRPGRGHLDRAARARGGRLAQRDRRRGLRGRHGRAGRHRLGGHRRTARGGAVGPAARGPAGHRRGAVLGPGRDGDGRHLSAVAAFTVEGMHHAWWRPGSAPSSASACGTAASAPIPTCSACSAWDRPGWPRPGPPCCGATAAASPARCAPAAGWGPRATTSMPCWPRCAPCSTAVRRRCLRAGPVTGDFWPVGQARDGATAIDPPERPAPVGSRTGGVGRPKTGRSAGRGICRAKRTLGVLRSARPFCCRSWRLAASVLAASPVGGSTHKRAGDLAWVTTEGSVTEPGSAVTPGRPDLAHRRAQGHGGQPARSRQPPLCNVVHQG